MRPGQHGSGLSSRWAVSLYERMVIQSVVATRWLIDPLSTPRKAKGRLLVASARMREMTPPWLKTATVSSGWRDAIRAIPAADPRSELLVGFGPGNHIPSLRFEHQRGDRIAFGDPDPVEAAFPFPQVDLTQIRLLDRRYP